MIEKHYKTAEIAELLSIAPKTLRRAALRGELTPVRAGSDLLWPESVIQAWLDRNRINNSRVVPIHNRASTTRRSA